MMIPWLVQSGLVEGIVPLILSFFFPMYHGPRSTTTTTTINSSSATAGGSTGQLYQFQSQRHLQDQQQQHQHQQHPLGLSRRGSPAAAAEEVITFSEPSPLAPLWACLGFIAPMLIAFLLGRFLLLRHQLGTQGAVWALFDPRVPTPATDRRHDPTNPMMMRFGWGLGAVRTGLGGGLGRGGDPRVLRQTRIDQNTAALNRIPEEVYADEITLRRMSAKELRARFDAMRNDGTDCDGRSGHPGSPARRPQLHSHQVILESTAVTSPPPPPPPPPHPARGATTIGVDRQGISAPPNTNATTTVATTTPSPEEKEGLIRQLLQQGGTTGTSCGICFEDYETGDTLRRLACGHKYHSHCIQRWAITSTEYSRPSACPVCNSPLVPPGFVPPVPSEGGRVRGHAEEGRTATSSRMTTTTTTTSTTGTEGNNDRMSPNTGRSWWQRRRQERQQAAPIPQEQSQNRRQQEENERRPQQTLPFDAFEHFSTPPVPYAGGLRERFGAGPVAVAARTEDTTETRRSADGGGHGWGETGIGGMPLETGSHQQPQPAAQGVPSNFMSESIGETIAFIVLSSLVSMCLLLVFDP